MLLPSEHMYAKMHPPSECIYAKMRQGQFINNDPQNFVTNRCGANPNTSPDSPSDEESEVVFGFAPHLFVTKLQASRVMDYPWCNLASYVFRRYVHLASYAFSRWASFGIKCSKGLMSSTSNCRVKKIKDILVINFDNKQRGTSEQFHFNSKRWIPIRLSSMHPHS